MTTYTETFTGQTTGANSTTFTNRYAAESNISVENPAVGEEDDRVLRLNTGDSGIQLQSYDSVDGDANRDNCDILCRFWQTVDNRNNIELMARASGSTSSETYYDFCVESPGRLRIGKYSAGSFSTIASCAYRVDTAPSAWFTSIGDFGTYMPTGRWLWFRFRVNGTGATVTLQGRAWVDGDPEPTAWDIDTTDTTGSRITAAGWCGVGRSQHTGVTYVDYFSVGTNGDVPAIAAGSGALRVTQASAHVLAQNTATPVRITQADAHVLMQNTATPVRITQVGAHVLYTRSLERIGAPQTVIAIIGTSLG